MFKYSVECFLEKQWILDIRYYAIEKDLNAIDLYTIEGKRKNAKRIQ